MLSRRPSPVILAAALVACSREPPAPTATPAPDGGPVASAPPPSASLPPIQVSPLIRAVSTASARDYPDFPGSIPGVLTVRAPNLDVQSHGVGSEPWKATFLVTNETTAPLSVKVSDLVLRTDEAGLVPEEREQPVTVKSARAEDVAAPVEGGTVTFTVPPRRQIEVDMEGDLTQRLRVHYHVSYRHEAVFSAGGARVTGRGYTMWFRRPLPRWPR
jgi:hypothetical protein